MATPIKYDVRLDSTNVEKGADKIKNKFKALATSAKAFAGALAGALAIRQFRAMAEEMDRIGKLATRLNVAPESIQRLGYAADLAGADMESIINAMTKLERMAFDKGKATVFEQLGIDQEKFQSMSPEEKILAISQAFTTAKDRGAAFGQLFKLLEDDAKKLVPLLEQGPAALAATMEEASVATEEQIRQVEKMNDEFTRLENALVGPKAAIMGFFADTLLSAKALFGYLKGEKDTIQKVFDPEGWQAGQNAMAELDLLKKKNTPEGQQLQAAIDKGVEEKEFMANLERIATQSEQRKEDARLGKTEENPFNNLQYISDSFNELENDMQSQLDIVGATLAGLNGANKLQAQSQVAEMQSTIIADSMAKVGGGGNVAVVTNPQLRLAQKQLDTANKSEKHLAQLVNLNKTKEKATYQ